MERPAFARLLRQQRLEAGLTQETLAERAGLSARSIQDLERGLSAPRRDTLERLLRALGPSAGARAQLEAAASPRPRDRDPGVSVPRRLGRHPRRGGALPRELSSFIGREQELAELQRVLGGTALLTLVGSGGVGKTRLALRLAAGSEDSYRDGVRLVELAPLADAALVPRAVATAVGLPERSGQPVVDALCLWLCDRRMLLLLDNCEHLVVACAQIADALLQRCPELSILATSREPLGVGGEVLWRVPSLQVPQTDDEPDLDGLSEFESVRLFVDRAKANLTSFQLSSDTSTSVARICRQLDGIPLAIELAAARVRALPVEQIAERLGDRFDLLKANTLTAPARQQTLQATIEWSYALLTPPEQRLFDRLAVFAGGWTLDAAEAVCSGDGVNREQVWDLLGRLVDKSMVLAEADIRGVIRYSTLETLRQFGQQRLAATTNDGAIRDAHACFYRSLAQRADAELFGTPRTALWLNRLEIEHDNLRGALRWLLHQSNIQEALELAAGLRRFWLARSHHGEGQAWFSDLLNRASSEAPTLARAKALNGAGLVVWRHRNLNAARDLHLEARKLLRTLDDPAEEAWTLWRLGDIFTDLGDYKKARAFLEESIEMAHAAGSLANEGSALSYLAWLELYEGDLRAARRHGEAALAIFKPLGYPRGKHFALHVLAEVSHAEGDYLTAMNGNEQCLGVGRELGDPLLTAEALVNLGRAASLNGDYSKARGYLAQALGLTRQLDAQWHVVRALEACAVLAARQGKASRAVRLDAAAGAMGLASLRPTQLAERMHWIPPLLEALGSERAAAESAIGREMQPDEVIAYALADDDEAARHLVDHHLTPREAGVLRLLAAGYTNSELAHELVLSIRTIERHIANIYAKIGAHGRADATAYALRHGIAN